MATIQDLPELVIIGILKNAMEGDFWCCDDIADCLPYLAICRQWRYLALPIANKNIIITRNIKDRENDDEETEPKYSTNIPLLIYTNCNSMVKQLYVSWSINSFIDSLHILMDPIAMEKIIWPNDVSGRLVGDALNGDFHYNPQKLDNEMYEKMSAIIDSFRNTFPNVNDIIFDIYDSCGVATQFVSKFVDVYSDKLSKLTIYNSVPLDLPCFPPNLTYLSYGCQPMSFLPMPKINVLPLKMLILDNIPNDFSWKQSFDSLVFPNLKRFSISSLSSEYQNERKDLARQLGIRLNKPDSQPMHLEALAINNLELYQAKDQITRLNLKKIPRHLHKLYYYGDLEGLEFISKLPTDAIDEANITFLNEINDIDRFYKVTNKMFGKSIKNKTGTVFRYLLEEPSIDFERTRWENITYLDIRKLDSSAMVKAVEAMPRLNKLFIDIWSYIDEDVDWNILANSKIDYVIFGSCEYDGPLEAPANFVLQLLKTLKCLQEVNMPEELHDVLLSKLEEAKKGYQHLQKLECYATG